MIEFAGVNEQARRIREAVDARIARVIDHGQFIRGPEVLELEQRLADYAGTRHCVTCGNGTDALQIALMALGVGPGDEVIVPAFSFFATVEAVLLVGARAVFVDVDARTFLIDPVQVAAAISHATKAVIAVSLFGQCADHEALSRCVAGRNIRIIEDAAQSFGSMQYGSRSCALGDVGCTSFFPSKPLGCFGDGGAVFTSDSELHRRILAISQHGQSERYRHSMLGMNSRLDTIQAAVLLEKLPHLDAELEARRRVADAYTRGLASTAAVLPEVAAGNASAWAQYTIRTSRRSEFADALRVRGIPTAIYYPLPLHRQPCIASELNIPVSEMLAETVISLPMHAYLSQAQIEAVLSAVCVALGAKVH